MELFCLLFMALVFDLAFGDPRVWFHPVALTGKAALWLETRIRRRVSGDFIGGALCAMIITGGAALLAWTLVGIAMKLGYYGGFFMAAFCVYVTIAPRSLITHALAVELPLGRGWLKQAREAVGMITSRDVEALDDEGVARSCVESLGENLIDGVISALFFAALGWYLNGLCGAAALSAFYRAANKLDATYGYKNARYRRFGTFAARLDDVLNFLPARLGVLAVWLAAALLKLRHRNVIPCVWRCRGKHPSPNSIWGMAAFAGALGVRLGGPTRYQGKWSNYPYWGEKYEELDAGRIVKARNLVAVSTLVFALMATLMGVLLRAYL